MEKPQMPAPWTPLPFLRADGTFNPGAGIFQFNGYGSALDAGRPALALMTSVPQKLSASTIAFNEKWADFIRQQLANQAAAMQELGSCKTPEAFYRVHLNLWSKILDEYFKHAEQSFAAAHDLADGILAGLRNAGKESPSASA